MRVLLIAATTSSLVLAAGCDRDKKSNQGGLPPAQEWKADGTGAMAPTGSSLPKDLPPPPPGMAQMGGGGNPHAGAGDPHAGLGIAPAGGGGVDVSGMGQAPNPNRPIDPSRFVRGVIKVHEKAKDRASAPGTAVFLMIRRPRPDGGPGQVLAVDKLAFAPGDLRFELTEANAMVAGTELTGEVLVQARYDQDGDALSKQPGDVVGEVRLTVPAQDVQLWLDTILP